MKKSRPIPYKCYELPSDYLLTNKETKRVRKVKYLVEWISKLSKITSIGGIDLKNGCSLQLLRKVVTKEIYVSQ